MQYKPLETRKSWILAHFQIILVSKQFSNILTMILDHCWSIFHFPFQSSPLQRQTTGNHTYIFRQAHRSQHLRTEHSTIANLGPLVEIRMETKDFHWRLRVSTVTHSYHDYGLKAGLKRRSVIPILAKKSWIIPIKWPKFRFRSATNSSTWWNSAKCVASMVSFRNTRSIEKHLRGLNPSGSLAALYNSFVDTAVVWVRRIFFIASSRLHWYPYLLSRHLFISTRMSHILLHCESSPQQAHSLQVHSRWWQDH